MTKPVFSNRWFIWAVAAIVVVGSSVWGFAQYTNIKIGTETAGNDIFFVPLKKLINEDTGDKEDKVSLFLADNKITSNFMEGVVSVFFSSSGLEKSSVFNVHFF